MTVGTSGCMQWFEFLETAALPLGLLLRAQQVLPFPQRSLSQIADGHPVVWWCTAPITMWRSNGMVVCATS